jgi:hypothetical protein
MPVQVQAHPRTEIPPISIVCEFCDGESKLVSIVPSPENRVYNYECNNGHRSVVTATDT